jgi:hypothetical protein
MIPVSSIDWYSNLILQFVHSKTQAAIALHPALPSTFWSRREIPDILNAA